MKSVKKLLAALLLIVAAALGIFTACSSGVTLSFETGGAPAMESVSVDKGTQYELPEIEWEGHAFEGWYLDSEFTGDPVASYQAEKSATFYAKWTALPAITLDLDGGSLEAGTKLYLKAGANVSDFMRAYIPTKADHEFGAWYLGDQALSAATAMPQEGLTLKARYKVAYTIQVYKQNLAQNGYEFDEKDNIRGYAYAGEECTPAPDLHGFKSVPNDQAVTTKVISETVSENLFCLYFDRQTYTVHLVSTSPVDKQESVTGLYGSEIEIPSASYTAEGYLLTGWATSALGEVVYPYTPATFNGAGGEETAIKYTVEDEVILYAVWKQGYTDLFGGADYVFIPDEAGSVAYLSRAGVLFAGTYQPDGKRFMFSTDEELLVQGVLINADSYAFYNASRSDYASTLYVPGQGLNEGVKLYLDAYNGITYSESTETMFGPITDDSQGTYVFDDDDLILATFTSGPLNGKTLTIMVGQVTLDNRTVAAFQVRNDEEYSWGEMPGIRLNPESLTPDTYYPIVSLDGFGTATLSSTSSTSSYYYSRSGDVITLINSNGSEAGTLYHILQGSMDCYAMYDADLDRTYTSADGKTFKIDGTYNATYTDGSTILTGYFYSSSTEESDFGTPIHFVYSVGSTMTDRLFLTQEVTENAEGAASPETKFTFVEKPLGYAEYHYCDLTNQVNVYYAPMIVFNDDLSTVGKITVYGYAPATGTYEKALIGSFEEQDGKYAFTTTQHLSYSSDISTAIFDYSKISAIVFGVDSYSSSSLFGTQTYSVAYFYTVTTTDTENQVSHYDTQYKEKDGTGTLTLVGPFGIYTKGSETHVGQFTWSGTDNQILRLAPSTESRYYYYEVDADAKDFIALDDRYGTAYRYSAETGNRISTERLVFDGKGGATYTYTKETEGEEEPVTEEIVGKYERTEKTSAGSELTIYKFTSDEKTFEFVLISLSGYNCFSIRDEKVPEEGYTRQLATGTERLLLDGFGLYASYTDETGVHPYQGIYLVEEENVVLLIYNQQYGICFDLKEDGTFTVRGGEYGSYLLVDNNGLSGEVLLFDGYNHLTVSEIDENGDLVTIDEEGSYTRTETGFHIVYKKNNETIELDGRRGTLTSSGQTLPVFFIEHKEVVYTYVDVEDWTILVLDAYGGAVKHTQMGGMESGRYYLVTENLMYYSNLSGTDDYLYRYDNTKGTIERFAYTSRGYYTKDLDALLFDEGGFMISGGDTLYYYEVLADGNVNLYHQDPTGENPNRYGFVTQSFGKFEDKITFEGKEYYSNSGYAIRFTRDTATAEKYPVKVGEEEDKTPVMATLGQLTFAPTGSDTFTVRGTVLINNEQYSCTVSRVVDDEGKASLSVSIGQFVFDIEANYSGDSLGNAGRNTYSVTAMRTESTYLPSAYLMNFYLYLMFFGQTLANTVGQVTFVTVYNEEGVATEHYIDAQFGESLGIKDSEGNFINLEHREYTQDAVNKNLYLIDLTDEKGVNYRFRIQLTADYVNMLGVYSYDLVAFSRVESFETDHYKVEIEYVVSSDGYEAGDIAMVTVWKDDAQIRPTSLYMYNNTAYLIVENTDESGTLTSVVYYLVDFTLDDSMSQTGSPVYKEAKVTEKTVKRYFVSGSTVLYADISEDSHEVLMFAYGRYLYLGLASEYDEETKTYTVTTFGDAKYTVKVDGENVTIEAVPAPEEEEGTPEENA